MQVARTHVKSARTESMAQLGWRHCEPRDAAGRQGIGMAEELAFKDEASEYDRAFAHVTAHFMPFLLRAAHIAPGMHVLDVATGTGLSAAAALAAVGPTGYVMGLIIGLLHQIQPEV